MQLVIAVNDASCETLQNQICRQIIQLIETSSLKLASEVPGSRTLSEQLGVSRNTVKEAYDKLIDQGYLYTRKARGTFVCEALPEDFSATRSGALGPATRERAACLPLPYGSRGRTGLHQIERSSTIDFSIGRVDRRVFPEKTWRRLTMDCLGGGAAGMCDYLDPCGLLQLREVIAGSLGPSRGMTVAPEQVIIVGGCQQGMSLVAHLLIGANESVAVEVPCYRGAAFLFESYGARLIPVPVDEFGIDTSRLPSTKTKFVYVTPSHQFPTGVTLSLERREALLAWAARIGSYVVEVDYDADFRYEGSPLPSLSALDRNESVIYMSSFSNSVAPGLRLGYVVLPPSLVQVASKAKALLDNGQPWLEQITLATFMDGGHYDQHLRRIRQLYMQRRDSFIETMTRHFGAARITGAQSGRHVMWQVPDHLPNATRVQGIGKSANIGLYSLDSSPAFFYEGMPNYDRAMLFGYSSLTDAEIRSGVSKLAAALEAAARH